MKPKKFSKNLIKDILKQKVFDVEIDLDDFDLIKHDNWILEQIRKREMMFFSDMLVTSKLQKKSYENLYK